MASVTLPFTLNNGTTADADEVQANDNALRDGVNNVENEQIVNDTILEAKLDVSIKPATRYTENGGQQYVVDALNWIVSTTSPDLNYTTPTFVSYVAGIRIPTSGFLHAYTALKDTYLDIDSSGVITFTEVANGAAEPAQVAGTLRLKKVITNASTVTDVVVLATNIAFPAASFYEYKYAEINISRSVADPDVLGNQQITLIARGKDNTSIHELDTGTSGVIIDTANKELPNGMDENVTPPANSVWSMWLISSADGSQPVAGILSRQSAPFGIGNPLYPPGYDIARWIGLVAFDSNGDLIAGVQSGNETILHENMKNIFPASMNGTWTIIDFETLRAGMADHVGHAYICGRITNTAELAYANHSVTGTTVPSSQAGSVKIAETGGGGGSDLNYVFVPLSLIGQANFFSNHQVDGTSDGQQGGDTTPQGLSLCGFRYKHD